jgi:hypothetical protein
MTSGNAAVAAIRNHFKFVSDTFRPGEVFPRPG